MLIGNYCVLNKTPGRWFAGNSTSHASGVGVSAHRTMRGQWNTNGPMRGVHYPDGAETAAYKRIGYPVGGSGSLAWMMPYEQGDMKSYNDCDLAVSAAGTGGEGLGFPGESTLSFVASAIGQLVSQGNGSATISITSGGAVTATLSSPGAATITVSGTLIPGATGWVIGQGSVFIDGSLEPYAAGTMVGTTEEAGLTNAGIANSVWGKIIEAGFSADQILRLLAAHAAGSATGLEGSNPQFTGLDGTTVRIDGSYVAGTRTIDSLNGD